MRLVQCPRCGIGVLANAEVCPSCGKKLKADQNSQMDEETNTSVKYKVVLAGGIHERIKMIREVREITGTGIAAARDLVDSVPSDLIICDTYEKAKKICERITGVDKQTVVHIVECSNISCPQCGSKKIKKMISAVLFGKSTDKKWKCHQCGYKW